MFGSESKIVQMEINRLSPRSSYCSTDVKAIEHSFCECHIQQSFYFYIQQWCVGFELVLPELYVLTVLYGLMLMRRDTLQIKTLMLLYNKIVFSFKSKNTKLSLVTYKVMVKELELMENNNNISKRLNQSMKQKKTNGTSTCYIHLMLYDFTTSSLIFT